MIKSLPIDIGLTDKEIELIRAVLSLTQTKKAVLFGSRAKGNFRKNSDIDIALFGDITAAQAEEIVLKLDLLPLPFLFDIQSFAEIKNVELKNHIERVGVTIYDQTQFRALLQNA